MILTSIILTFLEEAGLDDKGEVVVEQEEAVEGEEEVVELEAEAVALVKDADMAPLGVALVDVVLFPSIQLQAVTILMPVVWTTFQPSTLIVHLVSHPPP